MTCPHTANLAGTIVSCDGKCKATAVWHNLDYSSLPKGFLVGDVAAHLREQGVTKIKFWKKP